jgi:hypothetical protein
MNRNVIIAIVVAIVVVIFAAMMFTGNNQAPTTDGAATVTDPQDQVELPAGPASEPAETTGNDP